jgi:RNA polymerase sigma-70 factor (ECF subfamily)
MDQRFDGDDVFVRDLYDRYYAALRGYVVRLSGGDQGWPDEVVQETLLRAWQHADELEVDTAAPWLYTVAHNIAVSTLRRQRRWQTAATDVEDIADSSDLDSVLDSLLISTALEGLTDTHRAVLEQLYFHGKTVAEVAVDLGIPLGTVKSRSHYALRALREALEVRGVFSP